MIKFFRHFRQAMVKENRVRKYMLYAIGEIVLVVIGILIALQLNNWNTERKAEIQEVSLLKEMRQNLERDLSDCRFNIKRNTQLNNGIAAVSRHLEERTPFHDTIRTHYANIWGSTLQYMNSSAYDNLNSIGFDIIQNDSLRRSITRLYSERYPYIKTLEIEFDNKIQLNEMLPQMNAKVIIDPARELGYPVDAQSLMDDLRFKELLKSCGSVRSFMLSLYKGLEQDILALIKQIDEELKSRE